MTDRGGRALGLGALEAILELRGNDGDFESHNIGQQLVVDGETYDGMYTNVIFGDPLAILIQLVTAFGHGMHVVYEINNQTLYPAVWESSELEPPRSLVWDNGWQLYSSPRD